jgi:hypothetical protein
MPYPQTYNTVYVNSATTPVYIVTGGDTVINVDSTQNAVTIILPNIANSGLLLYITRLFINDVGNNAATNNIAIKPNHDKINNDSSFVISTNGESVDMIPCSNTEWLCNSSNSGTTAHPAWNLLGNAGTDPSLDFVGTTDNQPLIFKVNNSLAGQINNANSNVSLGLNALNANSLLSNTDGVENVAIGLNSMLSNTVGNYNTAIGTNSLSANQGDNNTSMGYFSLTSNTTGESNVAIGFNALFSNTVGVQNVAIGSRSLENNLSGVYSTAIGTQSLRYNTSGEKNTAVGLNSLYHNTTGSENTAIGMSALSWNTTGTLNIAIGVNALFNNDNGIGNVAVGNGSLQANTQGLYNISVGMSSGTAISNGSNNTFLGSQANAADDFSNCTAIGFNSYVKANNQMQLGNNLVSVTANSIATLIEISSVGNYSFDYTTSANDTVITALSQPVQLPSESLIPDGLEIKIISSGGNNMVTSPNNFNIVSYNHASPTYILPTSMGKCVSVTLKYSVFYLTWYVISSNIGS